MESTKTRLAAKTERGEELFQENLKKKKKTKRKIVKSSKRN